MTCEKCKHAYIGEYTDKQRYRCSARRARFFVRCDMPWYTEEEIDHEVWEWITGIVVNPDKVEEVLTERQRTADEQNARVRSLIATTDRLIAEPQAEQDRVLTLYKKGRLDEERWEAEDAQYTKAIAARQAERAKYVAQLAKVSYTPEYIADVKATCARIRVGFDAFTSAERRDAYELLDLRLQSRLKTG